MNLKKALELLNTRLNLKEYELNVIELLLKNGAEGSVPNSKIYQILGREVLEQRNEGLKFKLAEQKLQDLFDEPQVIQHGNIVATFPFLQAYELRIGSKEHFKYRISSMFLRALHDVAGPVDGLLHTYVTTSSTIH
jgi:hypothetical protein